MTLHVNEMSEISDFDIHCSNTFCNKRLSLEEQEYLKLFTKFWDGSNAKVLCNECIKDFNKHSCDKCGKKLSFKKDIKKHKEEYHSY